MGAAGGVTGEGGVKWVGGEGAVQQGLEGWV